MRELDKNDGVITSVFNIRCNRLLNVSRLDTLFLGYQYDADGDEELNNKVYYDFHSGVTDNNGSVKLSSINIAEYNARLYKTASSIRDVVNRQLKESNLFIDGTGVM
jgi:hypothetical protein